MATLCQRCRMMSQFFILVSPHKSIEVDISAFHSCFSKIIMILGKKLCSGYFSSGNWYFTFCLCLYNTCTAVKLLQPLEKILPVAHKNHKRKKIQLLCMLNDLFLTRTTQCPGCCMSHNRSTVVEANHCFIFLSLSCSSQRYM